LCIGLNASSAYDITLPIFQEFTTVANSAANIHIGSGIAKLSPGAKRSRKALLDKKFRIG
jgi:hypothetical protein